jgi:hypothetical protein
MYEHGFTAEFGIMSVAVLTELLKTLVGKELLSPRDVRDVLHRASHEISGLGTEPTRKAAMLIKSELLPQFSEEAPGG